MRYLVIAAAVALALGGCNRNTQQAEVRSGGTLVLHGANGTTAVISKGAPSNLPPYAKLFPGAQVTSSMDMGAKGGIVTFVTGASPDEVASFYKNQAAGAQLGSMMDSAQMSGGQTGAHVMMFAQNGTQRNLTVSIERQGGQTKVGLTYGPA